MSDNPDADEHEIDVIKEKLVNQPGVQPPASESAVARVSRCGVGSMSFSTDTQKLVRRIC